MPELHVALQDVLVADWWQKRQMFTVADYFRATKLREIIAEVQRVHVNNIGMILATPLNDLNESTNSQTVNKRKAIG